MPSVKQAPEKGLCTLTRQARECLGSSASMLPLVGSQRCFAGLEYLRRAITTALPTRQAAGCAVHHREVLTRGVGHAFFVF